MKPVTVLSLMTLLALPLAAADSPGTVPRSAADKYAAHAEAGGAAIGATLLKPKEVRKAFTTDLSHCCLVVEVALYPAKDKAINILSGDFVLRLAGTETASKPSSARLVAAQLEEKDSNSATVSPAGEVHVGYESGVDPITGQRIHATEVGAGVGVAVGNPASAPVADIRRRDLMEMELSEKALPEDAVSTPVAGYLYFSMPKDNKKAAHALEYTLNGRQVSLRLD